VRGALPNLIVIGAMKAGTSALHYYLDLHPEIAMSSPKELDFFVDGAIAEGDAWRFGEEDLRVEQSLDANWSRGVDWYSRHFRASAPVRGEASPSYSAPWYPEVAERMASLVPDARLIFLVRDPAARAISNYAHQRTLGRDRRAIEEALGDPRSPYVARSRYALAIEPFLRSFDRSQLLVVSREELLERRRETVRAAYRFAGVDESFWSDKAEGERYRGEAKAARGPVAQLLARSPARALARRLPDAVKSGAERALAARRPPEPTRAGTALRTRLTAFLRDDVRRLEELVDRGFPEWSAYR
jgi:hypothetical protein